MNALLHNLLLMLLLTSLLSNTAQSLDFATDDEKNSMAIFQHASPAVVYVNNKALRRSFFSLDVQEIPAGSGTGFIWDKSGLIVTNYHVINGADRLTVTLTGGAEQDAQIIGVAPEKDLAVLRIEAPNEGLQTLPLGDSDQLSVGQKVLAIGNPFGLDTTLTTGVVSALGREINARGNRKIRNVIQTDAAINPGNSGGPLLNSQGQLIGVNTAIYSPSGASAGIGFAIPVNTVKRVIPQLISYGRLQVPTLGIELVSDRWVQHYRIKGVPILSVQPGLGAHKAGLQGVWRNRRGQLVLGDIIIAADNQPIGNADDYYSVLEKHRAGDEITLDIMRDNTRRSVRMTLARIFHQ